VVVYSITSRQSFEDIRTMRDQILRVKNRSRVPLLLVGNKCDMSSQREVSTDDGGTLARIWGAVFLEASAKSAANVNELFIEIVREMKDFSERSSHSSKCMLL
jgi:GTPase SAR1 family protein